VEHVLGKVTASREAFSGPDALLDIVVDRQWLKDAKTIEIDLPRHLCCAACQGAGCNVCEQSGAITLRARMELAEVLRVTLPKQDFDSAESTDSQRALTLKVPGYGGLPKSSSSAAPRGRLLLRIKTSGTVSSCVREIDDATSERSSARNRPAAIVPEPISSRRDLQPEVSRPSALAQSSARDVATVKRDVDETPPTRRSFAPPAPPRRGFATPPSAQVPRQNEPMAVEPSAGWTWRDTLIGLVVLILGAVVARLLF
jgi:hypothetical protein